MLLKRAVVHLLLATMIRLGPSNRMWILLFGVGGVDCRQGGGLIKGSGGEGGLSFGGSGGGMVETERVYFATAFFSGLPSDPPLKV